MFNNNNFVMMKAMLQMKCFKVETCKWSLVSLANLIRIWAQDLQFETRWVNCGVLTWWFQNSAGDASLEADVVVRRSHVWYCAVCCCWRLIFASASRLARSRLRSLFKVGNSNWLVTRRETGDGNVSRLSKRNCPETRSHWSRCPKPLTFKFNFFSGPD